MIGAEHQQQSGFRILNSYRGESDDFRRLAICSYCQSVQPAVLSAVDFQSTGDEWDDSSMDCGFLLEPHYAPGTSYICDGSEHEPEAIVNEE
jgi:hypothetical protein